MNFNAANARQPNKLGARRVAHEVGITNPDSRTPPPYNPYDNSAQAPSYAPYQLNHAPPVYAPQQSEPYNPNTYYGPPQPAESGFSIPTQYLSDPIVANAAMQYGQQLMGSGTEYVGRGIEKLVSVPRLKYYFAVDTNYVLNKLRLLFFPFSNQDWSLKYAPNEPVQPRFEINAPDLYIPTMAYLTYVLVAGLALGTQDRFTPESLGIQASSALAWTILEVLVYLICFYVMNVNTTLSTFDMFAFAGYKFVGIIVAVLTSLIFLRMGYYCSLVYCSLALSYFLLRTLRGKVLSVTYPTQTGHTRRLYLLLTMACIQPFLMWFLSYHLIASAPTPPVASPAVPAS